MMSESSLDYRAMEGDATAVRLLSGVDTLCELLVARRALDARAGLDTATFVSGYPGSPLGGLVGGPDGGGPAPVGRDVVALPARDGPRRHSLSHGRRPSWMLSTSRRISPVTASVVRAVSRPHTPTSRS
jgi:hypothetical protein